MGREVRSVSETCASVRRMGATSALAQKTPPWPASCRLVAHTAPNAETCGFARLDATGALIPGSTFEPAPGCTRAHLLWDAARARWAIAFNVGPTVQWGELDPTGTRWARPPSVVGAGYLTDTGTAFVRAGDRYLVAIGFTEDLPVLAEIDPATDTARTTPVGERSSRSPVRAVVAAQGTRYAVAWVARPVGSGNGNVELALIARGATYVAGSQRTLAGSALDTDVPSLVADAAGFAVAWSRRNLHDDAFVARLDRGALTVSTATLAASPTANEWAPELHWNGCQLAYAVGVTPRGAITQTYFGAMR